MTDRRTDDRRVPLTVLGLGNVLCGDDGLGVSTVAALLRGYVVPPEVRVLDGGTLGLALLPVLQTTRAAILVDAIDDGSPPGTLVRFVGHEVVRRAALRLSVHQIGVADLLDASELVGDGPDEMVLLGIVPRETELVVGLTPPVAQALPLLLARLVDEIERLGFPLVARTEMFYAAAGARDPLGLLPLGCAR